jgi:SAM-dependent methyltransferase
MKIARALVSNYLSENTGPSPVVLDFGSQSVSGQRHSYRSLFGSKWRYVGVDVVGGPNVDLILKDPYRWSELADDFATSIICGQTFEHVEYFWATSMEMTRVLKPGGIMILIVPSSGVEHRYPLDCWRFLRDGAHVIANYAGLAVIEAGTLFGSGIWEDTFLVARKPFWSDTQRENFFARWQGQQQAMVGLDLPSTPQSQSRNALSTNVSSVPKRARRPYFVRLVNCIVREGVRTKSWFQVRE